MTLDSLHLPGNATHGFMDFMLMMGAAGDGVVSPLKFGGLATHQARRAAAAGLTQAPRPQ